MEGHGKAGSVPRLLLLVLSLLLCKDVASRDLCDQKCMQDYGKLFFPLITDAHFMSVYTKILLEAFEADYFKESLPIIAPVKACHTESIRAPQGSSDHWINQYRQDLRYALRLMYSWNAPLRHLANEAHRLPEFSRYLRDKVNQIAGLNHHLQGLMHQFSTKFDPEITKNVDYARWTELPSLQTDNDSVRRVTAYKLLRCWLTDSESIAKYLKVFLCDDLKFEKC